MVKVLADTLCFFLNLLPSPCRTHSLCIIILCTTRHLHFYPNRKRVRRKQKPVFWTYLLHTYIDINRIQSYQDFIMVISRTNMSTIISHKLVHLRQQSRHSVSSSSPQPASCSGSIALHAAHRRRLHESMHVSFSSSSLS